MTLSNPTSATPPNRRWWVGGAVVFVVAVGVRAIFWPLPGFAIDQSQWVQWAGLMRHPPLDVNGLSGVYVERPDGRPLSNYPPGFLLVLNGLGRATGALATDDPRANQQLASDLYHGKSTPEVSRANALLKAPGIMADALLAALLTVWLARRRGDDGALKGEALPGPTAWAVGIGLGYALAPAAVHDSAIWGQADAVLALLLVASLEAARRGWIVWMAVLATMAILTKAQAGMLAPIWVVVAFGWAGRDFARWRKVVGASVGVAVVMMVPFMSAPGPSGVWDAYASAAVYYPFTHLNGFSFWFLGNPMVEPMLGGNLSDAYHSDQTVFLFGQTPRVLGTAMLLLSWAVVFCEGFIRRGNANWLRWAARVLPLAFFMIPTQMHERYLVPAIAIWAWAIAPTWRGISTWIVVIAIASINIFWAWPGPASAGFSRSIATTLHTPILGIPIGAYCACAGILLLALALSRWIEPMRASSASTKDKAG